MAEKEKCNTFNWNWPCLQECNEHLNDEFTSYKPGSSPVSNSHLPKQCAELPVLLSCLWMLGPGQHRGISGNAADLGTVSVSVDISWRRTSIIDSKVSFKGFSHSLSWSGSQIKRRSCRVICSEVFWSWLLPCSCLNFHFWTTSYCSSFCPAASGVFSETALLGGMNQSAFMFLGG